MDIIEVPVSPGEVLDKITILEIKSERMDDAAKLVNVRRELELLQAAWNKAVKEDDTVRRLHDESKKIPTRTSSKEGSGTFHCSMYPTFLYVSVGILSHRQCRIPGNQLTAPHLRAVN